MTHRFRTIDAMRGFAALWVFAYHLWNVYYPTLTRQSNTSAPCDLGGDPIKFITMALCGFGYSGVAMFFVLSGFCIHYPFATRYHASGSDGFRFKDFAVRRFWRLYPAYFATLFLASLAFFMMHASWLMPPGGDGITLKYLADASGFKYVGINALFLMAWDPFACSLNITWTLWYELQFYLMYPLLAKACRRWGFGRMGLVLLIVELLFAYVPAPGWAEGLKPNFEWFFPRRYFEWFMGMWLAERLASGHGVSVRFGAGLAILGFGAGLIGAFQAACETTHELAFAAGSCGVLALLTSRLPREQESWPVRYLGWFGDISYSLYLVHMPVMRISFAIEAFLPVEMRSYNTFLLAGLASVVAVPLVAWVFYVFVERKFMKGWPNRKTKPKDAVMPRATIPDRAREVVPILHS